LSMLPHALLLKSLSTQFDYSSALLCHMAPLFSAAK
jgi:hypothetical protein